MFLLLQSSQWAVTESWTQDLFLTKEVLYHWAITAFVSRAENGAQTRDPQLGRLVLYQLSYFRKNISWEWEVMDSNHRSRKTTDLQSAPFDRSGNLPVFFHCLRPPAFGAFLSLLSDSNQRPRDYKSRALANWAKEAFFSSRSRIRFTTCRKTAAKLLLIFELPKFFATFFNDFLIFPLFSAVEPSKSRHRGQFLPQKCR